MKAEGLILTYFSNRSDAGRAVVTLRRKGFARLALISRSAQGKLQISDPPRRTRIALTVAGAGLLAAVLTAAMSVFGFPLGIERIPLTYQAPAVVGAIFGALLGWLLGRRRRPSVDAQVLRDHARWLVPEETLVVLQGRLNSLRFAVPLMYEFEETEPAVFVLHPARTSPPERLSLIHLPLPEAQILPHAATLAREHEIGPPTPGAEVLLGRLETARQAVHAAFRDLEDAVRLQQTIDGTSEWILDNEYQVEGHARDVERNLPRRFYRVLPTLSSGPDRGLPRVYSLAKELLAHMDLRLDRPSILQFLEGYQSVSPLTIGELWAVPLMLRIVLIEGIHHIASQAVTELRERELADFWGYRLLITARKDPGQLFAVLAELSQHVSNPSPYFATQIIGQLYDEEAALVPAQSWLERALQRPLNEVNQREQSRQAKVQVSISNAISSLRQLALLDWREVFEDQSRVDRILRKDPSGMYAQMDFETRNSYRRAVEELSRVSGASEIEVASTGRRLAAGQARSGNAAGMQRHIGAYLIGPDRAELRAALQCREPVQVRIRQWVYRRHTAVYLAGMAAFTSALVLTWFGLARGGWPAWVGLLCGILLLGPASQVAQEILNYLVTRLLPPRTLPKMDFQDSGIPDEFRTLVVAPVLMVDERSVRDEAEKLEIHFLANPESNLIFGLFTDYPDAEAQVMPGDQALRQTAVECIEALNGRHGSGRFFLLHRNRSWTESERKYLGWERKRGKLEELNRLIAGTRPADAEQLVLVGDPDRLVDVRFVITLDSDTELPRDSARRMIETLAHPLNRPRFDEHGRVAAGSYTIIQPRISSSLPSATATTFSRLFTDPVGVDPYTKAVSDTYQDLSGEGSYHGKGIYDARAFGRVLSGRFPEQLLLSHDLIEGAHVRVGLASDIELFDAFPSDYATYTRRQHRWIRGDWQIANWITSQVPTADGGREPNPISLFNRWKIFDNLRRSLVPATSVGLLMLSWFLGPRAGLISTAFIAATILFRPLAQPFTWATTARGLREFSLGQIGHDLLRALTQAALMAHQASSELDAIIRVCYRRLISKRRLLEWAPAQMAQWSAQGRLPLFLRNLSLITLFSLGVGAVLNWSMPASLPVAIPWLALWALTPLIAWRLSAEPRAAPQQAQLSNLQRKLLRQVARKIWHFFDKFVNDMTSWLPPDNYQVSHQDQLAMRTSPTNIGMWMLSVLGAYDFGYLTGDQVVRRLSRTMGTLAKLERYEGHLLNWYDIQSLKPLEPRYVSSVDSGNLVASLWTLEHGLLEMTHAPLLDQRSLTGLQDVLDLLENDLREDPATEIDRGMIADLRRQLEHPPERVADLIRLLRSLHKPIGSLADSVQRRGTSEGSSAEYWARQLELQAYHWLELIDRYLGWVEILAEADEAAISSLGQEVTSAAGVDISRSPSLVAIAAGQVGCITALQHARASSTGEVGALDGWLERLMQSFSNSQWLAGEMLADAQRLTGDLRGLSEEIDMRFLYDPQRRLFSIGFNVSLGRLDPAHYDLLASEARLGSFVAIAGGEVPVEHWLAMHRPYSSIGGRRALLSWTGTMFEYLMPLLLQRTYPNSLLQTASQQAVAIQIAYGRRRGVPWGMSESAFGDLDLNKTYQYRAFGVPALGLKRGLEDDLVVAPYATLLALGQAPKAAAANLCALARAGLLGEYGYFEAIDYSRASQRDGERGVVVRAYMAHHQGMGFLALDNFLNGEPMQRRFHADLRVRAVEPLLYEGVPVSAPLHHISSREQATARVGAAEIAPSESKFDTPFTATPKTRLLSNGHYALMVTNAGGGYSKWGDSEITRWRTDTTRDSWGTFCYIRDADSQALWSNTYQPVRGEAKDYAATLGLDRVEILRRDHGVETRTEIVVSPEDGVELRRITLLNSSGRTRKLDLTSYIELSLAPHRADRQHPAFNKMFIQTEALADWGALLACRRPRSEDDPPVFVGHRLTFEHRLEGDMAFETDRRNFIGRGGSMERPRGAIEPPTNSAGFVLDPIFSLRTSIRLRPGESLHFSLILAASESRQGLLALLEKYGDAAATERAIELAWAAAQLELRLLRIQPDDARRFQQLANHLLYPNHKLRTSPERVQESIQGQSGLWPYGISGDLPIALVSIGDASDLSLVRQMLHAHAYWRQHGLIADLVILNEESSSYEQPLKERLEILIQAHSMFAGADQPGGVFLRNIDQIPEQDLALLHAVAGASLVAARGPLSQQLAIPSETPELPAPMLTKRIPEEPSAPLPFMDLPYFNSLGGFTTDGREYVIYLGPKTNTPAPWVNVIANPSFGTMVSEVGSGFTWYGNSQRNRLTDWSNDPVLDPASEAIYLRDEETGVYWTPTARPIRERDAYRARHGAGYSIFEHNSHAIEQVLTVFVPMDEAGGEPVKIQKLTLRNDSRRRRRLSLTYYVGWNLGEDRESSQLHVVTQWDEQVSALLATNSYHPDYGDRIAFASITPRADTFTGDRTEFIGRNGSLADPAALGRMELSGRTGAALDPCGALQVTVELDPGEETQLTCLLGQAESAEQVALLVRKYRDFLAVEDALRKTQSWWDRLLSTVQVETPELSVNFLLNRWLLYQSLSCRVWGRSAFYQSGGAFGFRDQLQDVLALLLAAPELAREQILLAARHQFREGDVQHWWHPPSDVGIRTRISDDLLWLPYVVSHYVRVTGDLGILREELPFLQAPLLEDDQLEEFLEPEVTAESASLWEHCRRAVKRAQTSGPHGLPLIGTGDWNDGMNRVGAGGRGESVWLAWFLIDVLERMAELAERLGEAEFIDHYRAAAKALAEQVEYAAWDGKWYLRATFDNGSPIGSAANEQARIDSLPQSWAVLSSAADPDRAATALESAWMHLVLKEEKLVLLLTPPFDHAQPSPGYIQGYPPGVRENGGQYTHASLWLAMATARRGDGDRAGQLLSILNPIEHTREVEQVWRYTVEPYVMAADVYRLLGRVGQGGWTWYTGSAAWMYRAWVEEMLGLRVQGDRLVIDPVIPGWWEGFSASLRFGEAIYEIRVEKPQGIQRGVVQVELDGRKLPGGEIPLHREAVKHRVRVMMGNPSAG